MTSHKDKHYTSSIHFGGLFEVSTAAPKVVATEYKVKTMPKFIATKQSKGEIAKAHYKNINQKLLAEMWFGDSTADLKCLMTDEPGQKEYMCLLEGAMKLRFQLDFDHIRKQKPVGRSGCGISIDKIGSNTSPSELFRKYMYTADIVEFACMIPLSISYHKHVTQSSYYGDIVLAHFPKDKWPWHLQSAENFNLFWLKYDIANFSYYALMDHLNDINALPIRQRLKQINGVITFV